MVKLEIASASPLLGELNIGSNKFQCGEVAGSQLGLISQAPDVRFVPPHPFL